MADLPRLDALGPEGAFRSFRTELVTAVNGSVLAELSLVSPVFVKRSVTTLRSTKPRSVEDRLSALAAAGAEYLGTVDGISLAEHEQLVCQASGIPRTVVRAASRTLATGAASAGYSVRQARPSGVLDDLRCVRFAGSVWNRRGEVLAVQAPGDHPAAHTVWLEALALGYRVALRPSAREPFTAYRLVSVLRSAGFGLDQVILLPTNRETANMLVDTADLALVYGDQAAVDNYADRADVRVQGPGRSKILLADGPGEEHIDTLVASVAGYGGTARVNASAVFVEGGAAEVAEELARRLAEFPVRAPEADDAVLPAFTLERAHAIETYLRKRLGDGELIADGDLVVPLRHGGAVLRPAVVLLDRADASQTGIELPFPCVWVAPWAPADGVAPFRGTLTLTAITDDEELLAQLAEEPSIGNLHIGDQPTYTTRPGLPQDGHLAEFLMRSKTVLRSS